MTATASDPVAVSVLGTGAIGTRVTEVLLDARIGVAVWNRTPDRTRPLVERGAASAVSALDAANAGQLILLALRDYAAVGEVLDAIGNGLSGRTVVILTTGTPQDARAAARRIARAGAAHLDGAVQTAPEDIGTAAATFLFSGSLEDFESHRDVLELLGSARHVGTDPAAAAVQDLALFGLWYDAQIAYLRALDTVRSAGIDVEEFAGLGANQLGYVVSAASDSAREVATRSYPRGPADLTEHAALLDKLVALRREHVLADGGLEAIHLLVQRRIAEGHGHEGLTAIVDRHEGP